MNGGDFRFSPTKINDGQGVVGKTGWFIAQDTSTDFASYSAANMEKLFRLVGRLTREGVQQDVKISILDLRVSADPLLPKRLVTNLKNGIMIRNFIENTEIIQIYLAIFV